MFKTKITKHKMFYILPPDNILLENSHEKRRFQAPRNGRYPYATTEKAAQHIAALAPVSGEGKGAGEAEERR
jgi:hypothetical protein